MTLEEAKRLMEEKIKNKNLQKHSLAVSVVMAKLAERLGQDKEKWALAGMLHDLDYDETKNNFEKHGIVSVEWLKEYNLDQEILDAILAHADKKERVSLIEKAIWCADPITGFLVACALIHPEKKLEPINVEFVLNRMKEKSFARAVNREQLKSCTELGLSLEEFIDLSLKAMKEIASELGL